MFLYISQYPAHKSRNFTRACRCGKFRLNWGFPLCAHTPSSESSLLLSHARGGLVETIWECRTVEWALIWESRVESPRASMDWPSLCVSELFPLSRPISWSVKWGGSFIHSADIYHMPAVWWSGLPDQGQSSSNGMKAISDTLTLETTRVSDAKVSFASGRKWIRYIRILLKAHRDLLKDSHVTVW